MIIEKIYNSLKHLLNQLGTSQLDLNFCVYHHEPHNNTFKKVNLVPNGENIPVTDTNKEKYAKLLYVFIYQ